jgi:hypothetical protein
MITLTLDKLTLLIVGISIRDSVHQGLRCSGKRQAWLLTNHFKTLLKDACLNHAYLIKHKLNDCGMIKNFMTSGSFTWDKEPEEDPSGSGMMPFLGEEMVKIVYDGRSHLGRRRMSNQSPKTLSRYGWGPGNTGM